MPFTPKSAPGAGLPALAPGRQPVVIGIDPGAKGALAAMETSGLVIGVWDWPGSAADLWALISDNPRMLKVRLAALEKQSPFPGQAMTNFAMGTNYGIWQGLAAYLGWPLETPHVSTWRKAVLDSSVPKKPQKADLVAFARRRWPDAEIMGKRGGAKDGRAEALCIAEYARRQVVGK